MKITPELLEKYVDGNCTEKEKSAVEIWQNSQETALDFPTDEKMKSIENVMWKHIYGDIKKSSPKVIPLYKKEIRYAAVACVVLGLGIFGANNINILDNNIALKSNASETRTITTVNDLELSLATKSTANLSSSFCNTAKQIDFCGNMKIMNTKDSNVVFNLSSICTASKKRIERNVAFKMKKNENYYLFSEKDKNGKEDIKIMDMKHLRMSYPGHVVHKFLTSS